jgi:acetyltransferase-like isoleucine patch superfamily enzyme
MNEIEKKDGCEPLITIITAVYNAGEQLAKTFDSVRSLKYKNIEYIVIDGDSTDSTKEVITNNLDLIAYYISEPDDGIADAWNKGLAVAKGDYICILNAGDTYDEFFINAHLGTGIQYDTIQYATTFLVENNFICNKVDIIFDKRKLIDGFGFLHTSIFVPRKIYDLVGYFNLEYKIAVDTEWMLRALKKNISFVKSSAMNYMERGGISEKNWLQAQKEYIAALNKNSFFLNQFEYIFALVKKHFQWVNQCIKLKEHIRRSRMQMIFILLALVNFLTALIPIHAIRRVLFRVAGYKVSNRAYINGGVRFFSFGRLSVDDGTVINRGVYLDNRVDITIKKNVSISHDVKIYSLGHDADSDLFSTRGASIVIEDYAVIFAGAILMPGVKIGMGAVVYPNSVVTKNVEPMCVVGGNPAKFIKYRKCSLKYMLDYSYWFSN